MRTKVCILNLASPNLVLTLKTLISGFIFSFSGHIFKSLNTSGLIPKQGKMVADRIDGIW